MAESTYQKLTRYRNRALFSVATRSRTGLWLGPDHLLGVDANGFTEHYKRFYFRDIQAITVQATQRRSVWNWILGILLALSLVFGDFASLFNGSPTPQAILFGILALVFGVPLVVNNLAGPTCICRLHTAVQIEELASLSRIRKTRKVLNRIRPLIAAAQGMLTPEEIAARLGQQPAPLPENPHPENSAPPTSLAE
jgi:hypothetical protein